MIQINNLSKSFGPQVLFENIIFTVGEKERIGLVGRNGSGKTTLFRIILNEISADKGEIVTPKNYQIGALEQHIKFTQKTLREECEQVLQGDQQFDFYKVEKILFGLGFTKEDLDKSPETFSGGYQIRINLAKVLVGEPNMLLLDEPSNYLDIVSLRWLKNYLRSFPGEILLITHDRHFMDSVTTHTMGIVRGKIKKFKGNTLKFYEQIKKEDEIYEQTRINIEKKRKEMEAFVDRFRAKASKATQAQSRVKMLEKMTALEELTQERILGFKFNHVECPGKTIMQAEDLVFSYQKGDTNPLIKDLSFMINRKDRIAIIGKNGKGKSTLLKLLASELIPNHGIIKNHPSMKIGHFGQTNVLNLNENNTIIEEIAFSNRELSIGQIRNICGVMMFSGDLAQKKIKVLSGGERSRVLLGKILAHKTNLLLLDEPNNHLDIESVEVLSEEIDKYPGAVVLVTHNELLLRKLAKKLVIFHRGKVEFFNGNYDDFLEKIGWEEEEMQEELTKEKLTKKDLKRMRAQVIAEKSKVLGPLKREIEELEDSIDTLEKLLKSKNRKLIEASQSGDGNIIATLPKEVAQMQKEIEKLFERLSIVTEECEKLEKYFASELEKLA